jgi:hypothetical protein
MNDEEQLWTMNDESRKAGVGSLGYRQLRIGNLQSAIPWFLAPSPWIVDTHAAGWQDGDQATQLRILSGSRVRSLPKWRNWQTRYIQGVVPVRAWRFESSLRHQLFQTSGLWLVASDLTLMVIFALMVGWEISGLVEHLLFGAGGCGDACRVAKVCLSRSSSPERTRACSCRAA